jgi:hypothetical protein
MAIIKKRPSLVKLLHRIFILVEMDWFRCYGIVVAFRHMLFVKRYLFDQISRRCVYSRSLSPAASVFSVLFNAAFKCVVLLILLSVFFHVVGFPKCVYSSLAAELIFFNHWVMHPVARVSTNICRNLRASSELYRPGGRHLSDRGCHVVSVTDP